MSSSLTIVSQDVNPTAIKSAINGIRQPIGFSVEKGN